MIFTLFSAVVMLTSVTSPTVIWNVGDLLVVSSATYPFYWFHILILMGSVNLATSGFLSPKMYIVAGIVGKIAPREHASLIIIELSVGFTWYWYWRKGPKSPHPWTSVIDEVVEVNLKSG